MKTPHLRYSILIVLFFAGISVLPAMKNSNGPLPGNNNDKPVRHTWDAYNKSVVDSGISLLRSGQVVLRMGLGADSYLLAQLNSKNKEYSHCGIVMVEDGYPFVYHCIGGEDNPDERMRRDSAAFFFSPLHNSAIGIVRYDFDEGKIRQLRQVVTGYYKERPKFDMKFDLRTDDKIYCAELVYKAFNKAMGDSGYIKTTSIFGYTFVGVENLFANPHAHIAWQKKYK